MRIELLCTGDEVLTGATVNTNFSHISQVLGDAGLDVVWGTTVGDDRETLLEAFRLAGSRADAVIVNGGLGPTVDDLSQEIAARAAGVELVFDPVWYERMEAYFQKRGRVMPPTNRKQAMLPAGAERLDNPIGTACGFAVDIGRARFYFTPGVPREMKRMLADEVVPRLLARLGRPGASILRRLHSFGLGESRVDAMLAGVEALAPPGACKLGFRAHYPQLETKISVRGRDLDEVRRNLAPVETEVRRRLGHFVLAQDDEKLEGVILDALRARNGTLAVAETFTGGGLSARIAPLPGADAVLLRSVAAQSLPQLFGVAGLAPADAPSEATVEAAARVASRLREASGASHALSVLIHLDGGDDRIEFGGTVCIAIACGGPVITRSARLLGGRDWIRLGATELGLDCLRRLLQGLPVDERIDFETV